MEDGNERIIYFDVETTGLDPWYGSELTCVCAKTSTGEWFSKVREKDMAEEWMIDDFFGWLMRQEPTLIVSKNGRRFDLPFLFARYVLKMAEDGKITYFHDILSVPHFDLQDITYKWISLEDMAKMYGLPGKFSTGLAAIKMWEQGRLEELKQYCEQDVKLTEAVMLKYRELQVKI